VSDERRENDQRIETELTDKIGDKAERKLKAAENEKHSIWFGLGMFGMVGWSVAVPVIAGVAIGLWLDSRFPSHISWCLTFLFLGVAIGAMIAWNWVKKEGKPD
jgi:ATP synthase protein I